MEALEGQEEGWGGERLLNLPLNINWSQKAFHQLFVLLKISESVIFMINWK